MKKQTFVLWALTGMLAVPASAQVDYKTRAIVAEPENAPVAKRALARDAEGAEYSYPVGLRNLGMIGQDDNACCNFLSFNKSLIGMLICGHRWGKPCLISTILPCRL